MTENREFVIANFSELQNEKFYSGISMKQFGLQIYQGMVNNNPQSDKRAAMILANVMGMVYVNNTKIGVTYSTPYAESNHAKQVNYFGTQKTSQLNSI